MTGKTEDFTERGYGSVDDGGQKRQRRKKLAEQAAANQTARSELIIRLWRGGGQKSERNGSCACRPRGLTRGALILRGKKEGS